MHTSWSSMCGSALTIRGSLGDSNPSPPAGEFGDRYLDEASNYADDVIACTPRAKRCGRGSAEDRVGAGVPLDDQLVEAVGLVLGDVDPDAFVVAVEWRALAAA